MVIADMATPNMSGEKLASERLELRPDIPRPLCTGFSEKIPEDKAAAMGIKSFLMKPFVMSDLANKYGNCWTIGPTQRMDNSQAGGFHHVGALIL